jgi:hypothetical protein
MFTFAKQVSLFNQTYTDLWEASVYVNASNIQYHCTVDLLFDWFGLVGFANKNKNCQLSYSRFQTSQTGGQWYSDTPL